MGSPPHAAGSRTGQGARTECCGKRMLERNGADAQLLRDLRGAKASQVSQEWENDRLHGANKPLLVGSTCGLTPELSRVAQLRGRRGSVSVPRRQATKQRRLERIVRVQVVTLKSTLTQMARHIVVQLRDQYCERSHYPWRRHLLSQKFQSDTFCQ